MIKSFGGFKVHFSKNSNFQLQLFKSSISCLIFMQKKQYHLEEENRQFGIRTIIELRVKQQTSSFE